MNANAKTTKAVKVDKSLYTGSGKQISSNQVSMRKNNIFIE